MRKLPFPWCLCYPLLLCFTMMYFSPGNLQGFLKRPHNLHTLPQGTPETVLITLFHCFTPSNCISHPQMHITSGHKNLTMSDNSSSWTPSNDFVFNPHRPIRSALMEKVGKVIWVEQKELCAPPCDFGPNRCNGNFFQGTFNSSSNFTHAFNIMQEGCSSLESMEKLVKGTRKAQSSQLGQVNQPPCSQPPQAYPPPTRNDAKGSPGMSIWTLNIKTLCSQGSHIIVTLMNQIMIYFDAKAVPKARAATQKRPQGPAATLFGGFFNNKLLFDFGGSLINYLFGSLGVSLSESCPFWTWPCLGSQDGLFTYFNGWSRSVQWTAGDTIGYRPVPSRISSPGFFSSNLAPLSARVAQGRTIPVFSTPPLVNLSRSIFVQSDFHGKIFPNARDLFFAEFTGDNSSKGDHMFLDTSTFGSMISVQKNTSVSPPLSSEIHSQDPPSM